MPNPVRLIEKKRDGYAHAPDEIHQLISDFVAGRIADYQMSAWLMAAWLRGLDEQETWALTQALLHSGRVLHLRSVKRPKIDKHSTGGVGDKISICLAPAVAACGVAVPMISGRGLGHTGGTVDKLHAIPGYQCQLDPRRFEAVVRQTGVSMVGQSELLAPADQRLYALRDVTATVESIPLITASILSKKLAAGVDGLVLDVKFGRGAFMTRRGDARRLAQSLVTVGRRSGARVVALLTDMDAPIGRTIGNALEVREALEVLDNRGPEETRALTLGLGVEMLLLAGISRSRDRARERLERVLADGSARRTFQAMVAAHGGDVRVVEDPERLPHARKRIAVMASCDGWVNSIDSRELGWIAVDLGVGRKRAEDPVDPRAGIELNRGLGDAAIRGEPLAWLHVGDRTDKTDLVERTRQSFSIGPRRSRPRPRIRERIA